MILEGKEIPTIPEKLVATETSEKNFNEEFSTGDEVRGESEFQIIRAF